MNYSPVHWREPITKFFSAPSSKTAAELIRLQNFLRVNEPSIRNSDPDSKFLFYASMVVAFGKDLASASLASGDRVILGLRWESSTKTNNGYGAYDDRFVVVSKNLDGTGTVNAFQEIPSLLTATMQ